MLSFTARVGAQGAPPGPLPPEPDAQIEQSPASQKTIRRQVNEVIAPVIVTDKSGQMLLSLTQSDFHVFDDGVEQPIEHFGLGGEPLSIVLVVEDSRRIEPMLPAIRKSGSVFAQPVVGQIAEAAVIAYDDSVNTLVNFTSDADSLQTAINHLKSVDGGAKLYDAMQHGISMLQERPEGRRRILFVVGESQDTGSDSSLGEVLRSAQVANATIYSISLSTTAAMWRKKPGEDAGPAPLPPTPPGDERQDQMNREMQIENGDLMGLAVWLLETGKTLLGPNALAVASKSTGGLHIHTVKDRAIEEAMDIIGGELHAQYTIGYRPTADKLSGYHKIKVIADKPGVTVRTRPGYYLAGPDS